jgi:TRAP-type C4-dicarboxylate transport system permease small subunit|tara:strand:+ start:381 stop:593 length:213 start_codon:yes stop_codon:yes gene_type:complete
MSDLYSFLRSILRLFFLIFSFLPLALGYRVLTKEINQFELSQLADMATVYGASGIAMLVILYILEIEKKK